MEKMSLPDGLDMYLTAEGVVVCQKCRIDWVIAACVFLAAWLGFFGHASCLAFAAGDSTKYASGLLLFEMGVVCASCSIPRSWLPRCSKRSDYFEIGCEVCDALVEMV